MSRCDVSRWILSGVALSAAAAVGAVSATPAQPAEVPLRIEWAGKGSPTPAGAAERSCSQHPAPGKSTGSQCPVSIALGPPNTLGVAVSGMVPGSSAQRAVDVINDGNVELAGITFAVRSSTSTPLTDGSSTGLQVRVDRCATSWIEVVNAETGARTYSCSSGSQPVVSERAVPSAAVAVSASPALLRTGVDRLRVTLSFPESAGLSTSGRSTVLTYAFNAVQKTGRA